MRLPVPERLSWVPTFQVAFVGCLLLLVEHSANGTGSSGPVAWTLLLLLAGVRVHLRRFIVRQILVFTGLAAAFCSQCPGLFILIGTGRFDPTWLVGVLVVGVVAVRFL